MPVLSREASGPQYHIRATSDFALTAVKAENDLVRHRSRRLHKTRGGGECSQYLSNRDCFAIAAKPAGCPAATADRPGAKSGFSDHHAARSEWSPRKVHHSILRLE
jgi:hypothetical protein